MAAARACRRAAAASAVLSALVVKGSFFIVVRLWFDAAPGMGLAVAQLLAAWAPPAILFGSVIALRQAAAETPDRLLDAGADRLPVPDVSARVRCIRGDSCAAARWPVV